MIRIDIKNLFIISGSVDILQKKKKTSLKFEHFQKLVPMMNTSSMNVS